MPIWGIVNQKGGVGKTTTAINVAAGLALRGHRTLLIDADPQGNATTGLGIEKASVERTLYDVLSEVVDEPDTRDAMQRSVVRVVDNLDVLPATLDVAGIEPVLHNAVGKELILRDALEPVRDHYPWIIVDAPPSLGIITVNILAAVERLLVPLQCEFYALEGLAHLTKTLEVVRRRINPGLEIGKVILTMYDARNKLSHAIEEEARSYFGTKVSSVRIPRNVRLSEAPSFGEAAVLRYPGSKGAQAYMTFVDEVLSECEGR